MPLQDARTLLLAPNQLTHLLHLRARVPGDTGLDVGTLSEAWRAAGPIWHALEEREAGVADRAASLPLPPSAQAHVAQLVACEGVSRSFELAPVSFALVALDQLVPSQFSLTHSTLDALAPAGAALPTLAEQLTMCLPASSALLPQDLRVVHQSAREMVLVADSHDLRCLDTRVIAGDELGPVRVHGHLGAVAGALIGHSANLVNAVAHRGRLVLNNGHHRVQALRRLGATHVPCLIQICGSRDEVMEVAAQQVRNSYDLFFERPRPPLLRDFDQPGLTCQLKTPRMRREIRVSISVESRMVAA